MKSLLEVYQNISTPFEKSGFGHKGDYWSAPYLYKKAKDLKLKPKRISLWPLDISRLPWGNGKIETIDDFLYHSVRVQNADSNIPIIIGWDGYIMDGWHRVVKAALEGKKTIKAYRFEAYVEPDKKEDGS